MFNSKSETFIFANCFLCKKRKVVGLALLLARRQYVNNGISHRQNVTGILNERH